MAVTQYIGARYVPIFADPAEWTKTRTYEPLTIVLHEGNSYTSKQFVPVGIDIDNDDFWAETGNYNAQVEAYRQEVLRLKDNVEDIKLEYLKVYKTVNDMKSDTELEENMVVKTLGYSSVNDGGGAIYLITANGVENSIDIIRCNNVFANLINFGVVNISSLGINNNAENNTNILTYALSKYKLYIDKDFSVNDISVSNSYIDFFGNKTITANSITLNNCNGNIDCIFTQQANQNKNFIILNNCENVKVKGKVIKANNHAILVSDSSYIDICVNVYESGFAGIYVVGFNGYPHDINIHDCILKNTGTKSGNYTNAIYINSNADVYYPSNVNVSNCNIINAGCGGVFSAGDYTNIENVTINKTGVYTQITAHGIRIHDGKYANINNCIVENSARSGFEVDKASYVNFNNCIASNCNNAGFDLVFVDTEVGRYYGDDANNNVTFSNCQSINNNQGNGGNAGFNITRYKQVSLVNCMVNSTGDIKHARGVLTSNGFENLSIIGCTFLNAQSNTGVNGVPDNGFYSDGNGRHFNMGGTYRSSYPNLQVTTNKTSSISESSDLPALIHFVSGLADILRTYGLVNITNV